MAATAAAAAACRRAVSYTLLGPPAESLRAAAKAAAPATGDMFLDLLDANFNKPTKAPLAKTLTRITKICNIKRVYYENIIKEESNNT